MTFLNPLFWIGALAIAGPLLLHLVNREQSKRVRFASLMLLPRLQFKQFRRRKLQHLFLLFLRCLAIILLVIGFSRPVITGAWLDRLNPLGSRSVVVMLDVSYSMSRSSVWQRALESAEARIGSLREGDEAALMVFDESGRALTEWERSPQVLRDALRDVTPTASSTSYLEALRSAVELFQGQRNVRKEIYWITDLQRTALSSAEGWKVPEDVMVEVEDVGQDDSNLFVEEALVEREVYGKQYARPIVVRLSGRPADTSRGEVQLIMDGQVIQRQPVEFGESGTQVSFEPFDLDEGSRRVRVVVEPSDSLSDDNVFSFVVERKAPRRILVVTSGEDSSFYLSQALGVGENLPFSIERVPNVPASFPDPEETPLIILDDVTSAPSGTAFRRFLEQGGAVLIVLGNRTRRESWSSLEELLPARLSERVFVRSKTKPFTSLTEVQWEHPVFSVFREAQRSSLTSVQFYGYFRVDPVESATVLARFNEGDPFVVEKPEGAGRVVLVTSSSGLAFNDFSIRPSYVPFWTRLADHTIGVSPTPAAFRVGQVLPGSQFGLEGDPGTWNVLDPKGKQIVGLSGEEAGSLRLALPGHYEVRVRRGTDWAAANIRVTESDLSRVPLEDIQAVFIPSESRPGEQQGEVPLSSRENEQSLWWLFLVAAGLVLLLETLVANRTARPVGRTV